MKILEKVKLFCAFISDLDSILKYRRFCTGAFFWILLFSKKISKRLVDFSDLFNCEKIIQIVQLNVTNAISIFLIISKNFLIKNGGDCLEIRRSDRDFEEESGLFYWGHCD